MPAERARDAAADLLDAAERIERSCGCYDGPKCCTGHLRLAARLRALAETLGRVTISDAAFVRAFVAPDRPGKIERISGILAALAGGTEGR